MNQTQLQIEMEKDITLFNFFLMPIKIKLIMTWWHKPLIPSLGRQRQSQWGRGQPGLQNETLFQYKTWFIKLKDINTYRPYCCYSCSTQFSDSLGFSKQKRRQAKTFSTNSTKSHFQKKTFLQSVPYFYNIQKKISFTLFETTHSLYF